MSETSSITSPLLKLLQAWPGVLAWRNNSGTAPRRNGRGGRLTYGLGTGSPDIVGIIAPTGRMFGLECKVSRGGVISKAQASWASDFEIQGGLWLCIVTVEQGFDIVKCWQRGEQQRKRPI